MKQLQGDICVVGAGVMGQAIIAGMLGSKLVRKQSLWAVTKTRASAETVTKKFGIRCFVEGYSQRLKTCRVVILAVKPSQLRPVLKELHALGLSPKSLILSMVTGIEIATIESIVGSKQPIIRASSNTPVVVNCGMTAFACSKQVTALHTKIAHAIFLSVGQCIEIDESLCDPMTALAGSGPAYMYLVMEALTDGGVRVGIPRDKALQTVIQTVLGAATLLANSDRHPASLREDVTTPAGCTIGGLLIMEDGRIRSIMARAVEEATRIARELGK